MDMLMATTSQFKFENKIVAKCYDNIRKNYVSMQKSAFLIAANISKLADNEEALKAEGFETIVDFGKTVLGIEKSQTYNFVNIGKRFADASGKCRIGDNYTMSQLLVLSGIKNDNKLDEMIVKNTYYVFWNWINIICSFNYSICHSLNNICY